MSSLTEIHVAFKSLFGLKHPIKEGILTGSRKKDYS